MCILLNTTNSANQRLTSRIVVCLVEVPYVNGIIVFTLTLLIHNNPFHAAQNHQAPAFFY